VYALPGAGWHKLRSHSAVTLQDCAFCDISRRTNGLIISSNRRYRILCQYAIFLKISRTFDSKVRIFSRSRAYSVTIFSGSRAYSVTIFCGDRCTWCLGDCCTWCLGDCCALAIAVPWRLLCLDDCCALMMAQACDTGGFEGGATPPELLARWCVKYI
jgi:hypothetical protein